MLNILWGFSLFTPHNPTMVFVLRPIESREAKATMLKLWQLT
jgi:hypothetical protein